MYIQQQHYITDLLPRLYELGTQYRLCLHSSKLNIAADVLSRLLHGRQSRDDNDDDDCDWVLK